MKIQLSRPHSRRSGFTMVELLVTISIIMVLMALAFGTYTLLQGKAKISKASTEIKLFENRLQEYEADTGEFPAGDGTERSTSELYQRLYEDGVLNSSSKIYMSELDPDGNMFSRRIKNGIIIDPFKDKNPYFYLRGVDENGQQREDAYNPDFDLWSLGPNGVGRGKGGNDQDATEDDITNWR
ncbi:MAG: prepilin-type N-terminal cleavage/methylation domain-containing protein [Verrucomicrobiota bacterium JB023]|nr:prepilin-type N-terminal cleavage/methylation domain-containing protein [Verrucomicrobiota bacterium JB023]